MPVSDLEQLMLEQGVVTEAQLLRARRLAKHLSVPRRTGEILVDTGQLAKAEFERLVRLHRSRLTLVENLREDGALDDAGLARYDEARTREPACSERELLVDGGLVTEEQFLHAVSACHDCPYLEPEVGLVDTALFARTSFTWLRRHRVVPMRVTNGALIAVLADPLNPHLLGDLERLYGVPVRACWATSPQIEQALHTMELLRDSKAPAQTSTLQYRDLEAQEATDPGGEGAIGILDHLLLQAIQLCASDLHIEPQEVKVRVRVRVDGVLRPLTELPQAFAPQVISRVKVLAGADIAERRLHQDGRICVRLDRREVDFRVSSYAGIHGETLVLRLLDRSHSLVPLEELGIEQRVLGMLREGVLRSASGMVLVTGPTGSGKTTTLYSFLDFVNDPTIKMITAEDPVEYVIEGITQCSVNSRAGPTFADCLRAMVRQDPDVIVVGEIRDGETASLAIEASLTGHKVFSTFHTEDAVGAVVRLTDMGVEPYLVSSTLACVVAQRLVRRICPDCAGPEEPRRADLRFLGLSRADLHDAGLARGHGCGNCGGTGYRGRIGIHEVLLPDDDLRDAILRRAPAKELRQIARRIPGFLTLQESGLLKVITGQTTLDEVAANAPRDAAMRKPADLKAAVSGRSTLWP